MQTLIKDCAKDAAKGDRERERGRVSKRERGKQSHKFAVLAKSKGLQRERVRERVRERARAEIRLHATIRGQVALQTKQHSTSQAAPTKYVILMQQQWKAGQREGSKG